MRVASWLSGWLIVHSLFLPFGMAGEGTGEVVRLEGVIEEALAKNPELQAAKARWQAAKLRIPQASALPDPTAGTMVMGKMLETRLGPQKNVFEVEQMVPFPGKLWEKHRMAVAEAGAAEAVMRAVERELILKVSRAYADLYAVDATTRVVEGLRDLLRNFENIAQARYASQAGSQRDVAKAQTEVSETLERLVVLRQQRQTLAALLNALLDRDPSSPVGAAAKLDMPRLASTVEDLLTLAKQHRPQLHEAQAMVRRDRSASALAKWDYLPDVSVGFQYVRIGGGTTTDPHDGRDAWMVPLKVTLPLWQNRLVPAVLEATRNLKSSEAQFAQATNLAEYEVKDAYYRFTAAKQIIELYENALLPEAELAFHSDQAGYEAGRTDALNLIDSERVYLNAKATYHQAEAEVLKDFAELERAVGTDLRQEGGTP